MNATSNDLRKAAYALKKICLHASTLSAFLAKFSRQTGLSLQSDAEALTLGGDLRVNFSSKALAANKNSITANAMK